MHPNDTTTDPTMLTSELLQCLETMAPPDTQGTPFAWKGTVAAEGMTALVRIKPDEVRGWRLKLWHDDVFLVFQDTLNWLHLEHDALMLPEELFLTATTFTNTDDLATVMYCNEVFDTIHPDTYGNQV